MPRPALPLLALLLALATLAGCAPALRPAGPTLREAAITPFAPPPQPARPSPWALAPAPPAPQPSGPLPQEALVMPDGMRLALRAWRPEGAPRAVLLALHGFGDHGGNLLVEGAPLLNAGGVLVYAYDQRGFGHSPHRGLWPGGATLVADARAAARLVKARHPDLPLFLLGESMGAAVALLAAREALPVAGVVLLAPAVMGRRELPAIAGWLLDAAAAIAPALAAAPVVGGITASDNPAAMQRFARDPLVLREVRFDMLQGLLALMTEAVEALPGCCAAPVLVLSGGQDRVVPIGIQRRVLARLPPAPGRRILFYPEGHHLLLRDAVRERVAADILAWMADPAAPLSAEQAAEAWLSRR